MFRNPLIDAIVVLVVVLLIFGPKRLPELGKGLGSGMREFKEGISGSSKDDEDKAAISGGNVTQATAAPSEPQPAPVSSDAGSEQRS